MSDVRRYLLDANVFMQAKNHYYGFEICPGFWKALIAENRKKRVISIDRVKEEISIGNDDLVNWAKNIAPKTFFEETNDITVLESFHEMVDWVQAASQFSAAAKAEFASVADGWLIAYAKVNGLILVTQEVYAPDAQRRVPIPNVCLEFDVEYVNTFEMLREVGTRFDLRKQK